MIFSIIKALTNIKSILVTTKDSFIFLKKNKILSLPVIFLFAVIAISTYCAVYIYYYNNTSYEYNLKSSQLRSQINSYLQKCGDKTGIGIAVVSTEKAFNNSHWNGLYEHARACDYQYNPSNCIVNLKDIKGSYNNQHIVDLNTYNFLVRIDNYIPTQFDLVNENNEQDLSSVLMYPTITKQLTDTQWYKEHRLNAMWITSITNFEKKVVYVLTLISGKPISELQCIDQIKILSDLKDIIKDY